VSVYDLLIDLALDEAKTMNDDPQDDIDQAAEHQAMLDEQRAREDALLAGAPAAHRELARLQHETDETCRMMNWAIDRIFRP
jgi:hypothetical protein